MAYLRRPLNQDDPFMPGEGLPEDWQGLYTTPDAPMDAQYGTPPPVAAPPPQLTEGTGGGMEKMPRIVDDDYRPSLSPDRAAGPAVDTSKWDVDSYGIPQYTAQNFGSAPSGWDPQKWGDPTHQTPKYVWGRIYQEAMQGGDPNKLEPAEMQAAIQRLQQAYPGLTMNNDVASTPWGEQVDLFTDFGPTAASQNGISWGVQGAGGGAPNFDMSQLQALLGNRANLGTSIANPNLGVGGTAPLGGGSPFADPGFQSVIEGLGPLHPQWAEYQAWKGQQGAGGGASGGSSTGPQAPQGGMQTLYDQLGKLLSMGGDYNEGILNRRIESSRESMNRSRNSQTDALRAQLAERGLLNSGAETTALSGLEENLGDIFAGNVRDIYADESGRADKRLMDTMGIAAGLSGDDSQRIVDWFNAHTGRDVGMGQIAATNRRTDADAAAEAGRLGLGYSQLDLDRLLGGGKLDLDRMLGQGNLGVSNLRAVNDYNLGVADVGLRRDLGMGQLDNQNIGNLINAIQLLIQQGGNTNQGYR